MSRLYIFRLSLETVGPVTADVSEFDSEDAAIAHGLALSRQRQGADVQVLRGQEHLRTVSAV